MNNSTSQTATPINHGRIPYLCSAKTSTGYCTNNADVVLTTGTILCNEHYTKDPRDQDGGCPWCGRDCPDAGKPQGCWYQGCPDFPHGE